MDKRIVIDANFPGETRVCVLDKFNRIKFFESESQQKKSLKGNIYLGKITRIEPSLQAAFVDFGYVKSGFLPFSEISSDYYQIPVNDRKQDKEINKLPNNQNFKKKISQIENDKTEYSEIMDLDQDKIDVKKIEELIVNSVQPSIDISEQDAEAEILSESKLKLNQVDKEIAYQIQEVITKGNIVLVQILKDEKGNKGPTLSTFISLAGKYCILMPNKKKNNFISKKIVLASERVRLKSVIDSLILTENNHSASIIIRTAAIGKSREEIARDYIYLTKLWNKMREVTLNSIAPCFIHNEDNILLKLVRDFLDEYVKEVFIQGEETYKDFIKLTNNIVPNKSGAIKEYKKAKPIFSEYKLEEQIAKLYQSIVDLPSGGTIVINPTEALISIDVNSGKYTNTRSIEEMALKNNVEASKIIANQIQLRNLSGLLVIDFIDMENIHNRKIVERSLKEFFRYDKARVQIGKISDFGLLEMSRQRVNPSFLELNSCMCQHCNGKGVVRLEESNAMLILRTIENELYSNSGKLYSVNLFAHCEVVIFILNQKMSEIYFLENKYQIKLNFYIDHKSSADSFVIEKIKNDDKKRFEENLSESVLSHASFVESEESIYNISGINNTTKSTRAKRKKIKF